MENDERDAQIALGYLRGDTATKLSRDHNLSVPSIRRILKDRGVSRGGDVVSQAESSKVIGHVHARLGHRLYNYRFRKNLDARIASDLINWSSKKLRSVEQGHSDITLTDLTDMAQYMGMSLADLVQGLDK